MIKKAVLKYRNSIKIKERKHTWLLTYMELKGRVRKENDKRTHKISNSTMDYLG